MLYMFYMSHGTYVCLFYKGHPHFGLDGARWFRAMSWWWCCVVYRFIQIVASSLSLSFFIFSRSFVSCDVGNLFVSCWACTQEHNSILCHLYGQPFYIKFSLTGRSIFCCLFCSRSLALSLALAYISILVLFVSRTASGNSLLLFIVCILHIVNVARNVPFQVKLSACVCRERWSQFLSSFVIFPFVYFIYLCACQTFDDDYKRKRTRREILRKVHRIQQLIPFGWFENFLVSVGAHTRAPQRWGLCRTYEYIYFNKRENYLLHNFIFTL